MRAGSFDMTTGSIFLCSRKLIKKNDLTIVRNHTILLWYDFVLKENDKMKTYISNEMKRYNHLVGEIDAVYHDISLNLGLSDSAMKILYTICDNGDSCLLQEISHRSGVSKQTINSAIRKLEEEGIVYLNSVGPKNKNVCLTDKGKQLAEHTAIRLIEMENDIFASWEKNDVEKYLELTERYLLSLKEKSKTL